MIYLKEKKNGGDRLQNEDAKRIELLDMDACSVPAHVLVLDLPCPFVSSWPASVPR